MRRDRYSNFAELKNHESPAAWRTVAVPRESNVVIIAPHGGGIEAGTSELARALAGEDLSLYLFEGLKPYGNRDLHITSSNFDEPEGVATVATAVAVVALHGAQGTQPMAYMGGLDTALCRTIRTKLTAAGFNVGEHPGLQGTDHANICNRGKSGRGVQIELTMALRESLFSNMTTAGRQQPTAAFHTFVAAVRAAVDAHHET